MPQSVLISIYFIKSSLHSPLGRWNGAVDLPVKQRRDRHRNVCTTAKEFLNLLHRPYFRALTDPLISGIANYGSKAYKLVGSYVSTPLNWYVPPFIEKCEL